MLPELTPQDLQQMAKDMLAMPIKRSYRDRQKLERLAKGDFTDEYLKKSGTQSSQD